MMIYTLQETADGGLKVTLASKNARLISEKPLTTSSSDTASSSSVLLPTSDQLLAETSKPAPSVLSTSSQIMYSDEESTPFFRRLAFSTDGALLITPAGQYEDPSGSSSSINKKNKKQTSTNGTEADNSVVIDSSSPVMERKPTSKANGITGGASTSANNNGKSKNKNIGPSPTSYVFARGQLANETPIAHLPGHRTSSIVVKFNPVLWDLRNKKGEQAKANGKGKEKAINQEESDEEINSKTMELDVDASAASLTKDDGTEKPDSPTGILDLKSRTIYALATHDTILLYDTQQEAPICMFSSLHFAAFTDLAWYVFFLFYANVCVCVWKLKD